MYGHFSKERNIIAVKPNTFIIAFYFFFISKKIRILFMLWSQMIYGHPTTSNSLQIVQFYGAGRRQEELYVILRLCTVPGEV